MKIIKTIIRALIYCTLLFILLGCILITQPIIMQPKSQTFEQSVDPELIMQHLQTLAVELSPRDYTHPENLNAAANYISSQWSLMGLEVEEQIYTASEQVFRNLIVHLGPESSHKIIVGAHYDTAGLTPGADDNASGVAGLLELTRLLQQASLKQRITLIAYSTEEPPFFDTKKMGSYIHAKREYDNNVDIELMISLEMIGYFSDEKNSQQFPVKLLSALYPDTGNFIAIVDKLFSGSAHRVKKAMTAYSSLPVYSINAPSSITGIDFSDHRNYWEHGYNAIMVTDTSFYRNPNYHKSTDTIETLDIPKMIQVIQGLYGFLISNKELQE